VKRFDRCARRAQRRVAGLLIAAAVLGLTAAGCGGGSDNGQEPVNPAEEHTAEGWRQFEMGDYGAAQLAFEEALECDSLHAEAWSGRGWAHLRLGERAQARQDLEKCLSLDADHWDAVVGLAVVVASLGEEEVAIDLCLEILGSVGDGYRFSHDADVTGADLRILLAASYFRTLQFDLALEQVRALDPGLTLDPTNPETWGEHATFEAALLSEIEGLALSSATLGLTVPMG